MAMLLYEFKCTSTCMSVCDQSHKSRSFSYFFHKFFFVYLCISTYECYHHSLLLNSLISFANLDHLVTVLNVYLWMNHSLYTCTGVNT